MHIFIIDETLENIKNLLREFNRELREVYPTYDDVKRFLDFGAYGIRHDLIVNKKDWKIYRIYKNPSGLSCVEFEYYCRTERYLDESGPDYHFGDELKELSRLTAKDIFYIWSQHIDMGYEVYRNGKCVNSVILDTHGPGAEVNGKSVAAETRWFGASLDYSRILDENSWIPKEIRKYFTSLRYEKLSSEYTVFINKEIPDLEALYKKFKELAQKFRASKPEYGCLIFFVVIALITAIILFLKK